MRLQPYELRDIPEALDADAGYKSLAALLGGTLPLFRMRRAREQGFDINSPRARSVMAAAGFAIWGAPATFSYGDSQYWNAPLLHADGKIGNGLVSSVHVHKTARGSAEAFFSRVVNDRTPLTDKHIQIETGTLDTSLLEPIVYHNGVEEGDVVAFAVNGVHTLAHKFVSLPDPTSPRQISLTYLDRL